MNSQRPFKRWYDELPALRAAIEKMEHFPVESQVILARAISDFAKGGTVGASKSLDQISPAKIEGLLKSERRLRWYDQNLQTYQAFKDFYSLEGSYFQSTAIRVILSVSYLEKNVVKALGIEECSKFVDDIFYFDNSKIIKIGTELGVNITGETD